MPGYDGGCYCRQQAVNNTNSIIVAANLDHLHPQVPESHRGRGCPVRLLDQPDHCHRQDQGVQVPSQVHTETSHPTQGYSWHRNSFVIHLLIRMSALTHSKSVKRKKTSLSSLCTTACMTTACRS